MNKIVARIDELRKKKGWSKYEIAKSIGVSANTVYAWYRTDAMPSLGNVEKFCEAVGITSEQFFCGVGSYRLSEEENKLLQDWFVLSDLEKNSIFEIIDVFKTLKL